MDRFALLRERYKKYSFPGWKNVSFTGIEFHFDDREVFDEVIETLHKKFFYNKVQKLSERHVYSWEKQMIIFIQSEKALRFLVKKYKLLER